MTSAMFLRGGRGDEYVIVAKSDVLDLGGDWSLRTGCAANSVVFNLVRAGSFRVMRFGFDPEVIR